VLREEITYLQINLHHLPHNPIHVPRQGKSEGWLDLKARDVKFINKPTVHELSMYRTYVTTSATSEDAECGPTKRFIF
jgi:hypothetical protein